ncbi:hypothetical protein OO007_01000 [Cocleimonas sp. KMM 6892]|uniref:hypothetical protein n=1 Tax=unclassified Cocleimonas TaxID=2639732 RepID=UPI002DBC6BC9|nr:MULTISPECIES: hypothetical protein [unclassified Cocleimonas]MEB8430782.1 hypothetical protein [Cocleimonas sp. KMM 6892]MEC4714446.1 hypothetical protein [Cocleimonas sp. KMM 6895]MEC4743779.1 hypothetical protein [Cocleimonas sp. KMM 6896]
MNVSLPLEEYINEKENRRNEKLDALLIERLESLNNGKKTIPAEEVNNSILKSLKQNSQK